MNPRQAWLHELVLCALRRAGGSRAADGAFLDEVVALALDSGAQPHDVSDLTCQRLSGALRGLEKIGRVKWAGVAHDVRHGRDVPLFAPVAGYSAQDIPPKPPRPSESELSARALLQGRKLARRLGAARDPHKDKLDKFFRDFTNDSASTLLDFKCKVEALVAKYEKRYQALVEERTE